MAEEGFKAEYRAQLVQLLDETAQIHVRKLARDLLASPRLAKFQEIRLWKAIYEYWREAALAYAGCIDLYASGAKGADALKGSMPLLLARALRALASQLKWLYVRYGPMDPSVWGAIARVYALAENAQVRAVAGDALIPAFRANPRRSRNSSRRSCFPRPPPTACCRWKSNCASA